MADVKISQLPAAAAANPTDQLETNQAGTSRSVTVAQVSAAAATGATFNEAVDDRVAALLTAGTNITATYNDAAGTLTVAAPNVLPLAGGTLSGPGNLTVSGTLAVTSTTALSAALTGTTATFSGAVVTPTVNHTPAGAAPANMGTWNSGGTFFAHRGGTNGTIWNNAANGATLMSLSNVGALAVSGALTGTSATFSGNSFPATETVGQYGTLVPYSSVGGTSNVTPTLQVAFGGLGGISVQRYSAGVNPGIINISKSAAGTPGTQALVQATDVLGEISFNGSDGVNFIEGAYIRAEVDATPGLNDMPTRLTFGTTADGAAAPVTRMTINNAGAVTLTGGLTAPNGNFTTFLSVTTSSASGGHFLFADTNTGGQTWQLGPGAGTAIVDEFNIYNQGVPGLVARFGKTGSLTLTGVPTALAATAVAAGAATQAFVKASSTANLGIYFGTGAPAFSAAKGSLYTNTTATTTTTRLYVNTDGATTWANFTASA
jgi:hypothetical protein